MKKSFLEDKYHLGILIIVTGVAIFGLLRISDVTVKDYPSVSGVISDDSSSELASPRREGGLEYIKEYIKKFFRRDNKRDDPTLCREGTKIKICMKDGNIHYCKREKFIFYKECLTGCRGGSCLPVPEVSGKLIIATEKDKYLAGEEVKLTSSQRNIIRKRKLLEPLPLTGGVVADVQTPDETIDRISYDKIITDSEEPKFKGYIIKFKEPSIIEKKVELEKEIDEKEKELSVLKGISKITGNSVANLENEIGRLKQEIPIKLDQHQIKIDTEHLDAKAEFITKITDFDNKNLGEFKKTFNGIALDIAQEEAVRLKESVFVEEIYPNYEVNALLYDSVGIINADDVWGLLDNLGRNITGQNVTIAVIDTGIDYTHPDLGNCTNITFLAGECDKVVDGYDFVNNDNDPMDDHGHGTHVAATAAGTGILKGVAPDADLYAYKVLNERGSGYEHNIILAISRALGWRINGEYPNHVDVISMSLGGGGDPDDPMSLAIDNAVEAGVVAVIAAGNSGPREGTIGSPGTARKAITVGATDKNNIIAKFSSRGPVIWANKTMIKPDVVAPGVSICAAQWNGWLDERQCIDDEHIAISGTSMAAPHVSGAVALLKQSHPEWSPEEIKLALRNTAVKVDNDILSQGYGRIDVLAAVNSGKPPIARLELPESLQIVINISGTSTADNFNEYRLYHGTGISPSEFIEFYVSNEPVVDDILYENFDLETIEEGYNTIRLLVFSQNNTVSEDRILIDVDNIQLTHPLGNDIFRVGDTIQVKGKILFSDFTYRIEHGKGKPIEWFDDGITLTSYDDVLAEWDTSTLTESDYYTIRLTINTGEKQTEEFIKNIYIDSTLKEGWPVRIDGYYVPTFSFIQNLLQTRFKSEKSYNMISFIDPNDETNPIKTIKSFGNVNENIYQVSDNLSLGTTQGVYYGLGTFEPVVADVDNDGLQEIFVYVGGNPTKIYGFKNDGSILSGWPVEVDSVNLPGGNLGAPSIEDIDGDGFKEIIVNGVDYLHVFNHDGSLLRNIQLSIVAEPTTETVIADLNNDNDVEIIRRYDDFSDWPYQGQKVAVLDFPEGDMLPGWPKLTYNKSREGNYYGCSAFGPESTPSVGNLDEDDEKEVIVASIRNVFDEGFDPKNPFDGKWHCEGRIYAFNLDGSDVDGFPVDIDGKIFSSPAVADINNDGYDEIIVATFKSRSLNNPDSGVYIIDRHGDILSGWPRLIGSHIWSSPAVADFNNDRYLEIVINDLWRTYVFDYEGNTLPGWPQYTVQHSSRSPVVGDVNGDGNQDIITTAGSGFRPSNDWHGGVYAWNFDGTLIDGFPKTTEVNAVAAATIADIDSDGKLELIASSNGDTDLGTYLSKLRGSIYVWELDSKHNETTLHWPMFHHDPQHTGWYYNFLPSTPKPKPTRPASIINNTGDNKINGYLFMEVQKFDGIDWNSYEVRTRDARISVDPHKHLKLGSFWNSFIPTIPGDYKAYAELRYKKDGQPIVTIDDNKLIDSWNFEVIPPEGGGGGGGGGG